LIEALVGWVEAFYTRSGTAAPPIHQVDEIAWAPDRPLQVRVDELPSGEFHRALSWSHPAQGGAFYWTVRCDLAFAAGRLDFQFQLGYDTRTPGLSLDLPAPGRPKIIPQLLEHPGWCCTSGGQVLTIQARTVTGAEVESLCDTLIFNGDRTLPVVLVSPQDSGPRSYPVDVAKLAERLAGTARVLKVRDSVARRALDLYLGTTLAVGPYSVRVFAPGVSPGDPGTAHWLFRGERIRAAFRRETEFANDLFAKLAQRAIASFQEAQALTEFRRAVSRRRLEREKELLALRESQRDDTATYKSLLDAVDEENRELRREIAALRDSLAGLGGQVESLQTELRTAHLNIADLSRELGRGAVANAEATADGPTPRTVSEVVQDAVETYETLEFLESAQQSADKVPKTYKFVGRVQGALELLNEGARTRFANGGRLSGGWKGFFNQRGHEYKLLSDKAKEQFRDEYEFVYNGRRELFEEHFTIGTRSANTCLSIHFSTKLRADKIVVAYVGRHLRNTQS